MFANPGQHLLIELPLGMPPTRAAGTALESVMQPSAPGTTWVGAPRPAGDQVKPGTQIHKKKWLV
jgi:hypothetical protein